MCRIAAYTGPEIPLENIVVRPAHSLLEQSQHATEAKLAVNGDGFGISWYGADETPGLYRDVLPAWADDNLANLCRMVRSRLFIAHVRASTMGETSRANCHPFKFGRWSFCHNGQIPHFKTIRRRMLAALPDHLFEAMQGTTDSEMIFLTMLANGLDDDPESAMRATLDQIGPAGDAGPIKLTCVFSDGRALYAFRHASTGQAPSLYASGVLDNGGRSIASEPLCGTAARWTQIPQNALCTLSATGLAMTPLAGRMADQVA
ncbi:class II glutamine amidotransferase [Roseobacter sp. CCS2]|uniref:class II glutamine amidotransferase n=1 Tax=Roseobacter sp. CCS2 TaxID=391593 RepID=UPI0000F3E4C7|nr:class II glutamine amidotransferase [Roseobacter sp. CCS2]EBA12061.1 Glutamine amidotransferase, class-II [Roseobacter sp. CCS2]